MLHEDGSYGEWEQRRLEALHRLHILDTPPVKHFEFLIKFIACTFEVPMAAISLVDERRLWFKASFGLATIVSRELNYNFFPKA
ncbi:hypothetical protein [Phytohalomonas tamaricis]|uniref:hypothetical protein n=1 Tax=Phytohalomonas tamaricis TaxID=2081032 RepID=UPI000D0AEEB5|nr:hypothetical protein [Phytohalomonas tamaricis]